MIVMLLTVIPSLIMLLAATGFGVASVRAFAVELSQNRLFTQAERIGDQFLAEVAALRTLAAPGMVDSLQTGRPIRGQLRELLTGRQAALIGPRDQIRQLAPAGLLPGPGILSAEIQQQLAFSTVPREGEPIITIGGPTPGSLWGIAPVEGSPGLSVARELRSPDLEMLLDLVNRDDADRIFVLTRNQGAIGLRQPDDGIESLIRETPGIFQESRGVYTVKDDDDVVYTSVRVGVLPSSSTPRGDEPVFVLVQRVSLETPLSSLLYRFWQLAILGLMVLLAVAVFAVWLSKRMVDPILQLRAGFQRLEHGDLDFRIGLHTGDELEELGRSMNKMAGTLQRTYENLANKLLELDEKARQLSITYEISQTINQSLEMDTLFRDIIGSVRQMVVAERLLLGLISREGDRLERVYTWPGSGWWREGDGGTPLNGSWANEALAQRRVIIRRTGAEPPRPEATLLAEMGDVSLCIVPLVGASGRIGVLVLADPDPAAFPPQEIEVLERLSPNLAMAVEHSRLYARQADFAVELESRVQQRTIELQRAQEQLLQVEKLAAAGELAANIAHEINNPLSIIKNYMKLLQSTLLAKSTDTQNTESIREGLTIIGEEIDRIARIVEQLRRVSMPHSPDLAPVPINEQLALMVELFRHTFQRKRISVDTELDPALGTMVLSGDYLRQIVINFLRNAHDAVDVGGRIIVVSRLADPDQGHYTIAVRDSGPGIPPENLQKIFDPFFTTKKEGKGTGLGLSVSYGLARQMGGRIEARSNPGEMTEMRLVLPIRTPDAASQDNGVVRRQGGKIIIG